MSVFGVDFGNLNSTVAITRYGGVDIVTNEVSKRETTTIVSFLDEERFIGEQGLDRYVRNAQNTIFLLKRFIGMNINDPSIELERRFLTCAIEGDANGRLMFSVNYCGKPHTFYPEQVLAMMLQKLRSYVNDAATVDPRFPADVKDCVITVPSYYTAEQRRLMYQAAEVAGLHCMSLINESAATAVDYGIFRGTSLKETEDEGQVVGILDIGYGSTEFTIAKFWKGNCKILCRSYDRHTGTRDLDYALFQHMAKEVQNKYHVDVMENRRARLRLLQACERLKYLLSANQSAPLNVENLMDIDVNIPNFERATFESIAADVLARIRQIVERGFAESQRRPEDFHSLEMIGGGCRIPAVKRTVEELFKRPPSFTLNASETTARGAAITAAMLSPKFQVREFKIAERATFPLMLGYHVENPKVPSHISFLPEVNKAVTLLGAADYYPKLLDVTIPRAPPYKMYAFYDENNAQVKEVILPGHYLVSEWALSAPSTKPPGEVQSVKVRVNIKPDGLLYVETAWVVSAVVQEEAVPAAAEGAKAKPAEKPKDAASAAAAAAAGAGAGAGEQAKPAEASNPPAAENKAEGGASAAPTAEGTATSTTNTQPSASATTTANTANNTTAAAEAEAAPPVKRKKTILKHTEICATPNLDVIGHPSEHVLRFRKHESEMHARDTQIMRTREKKNELESYILNYRPQLSDGGALAEFVTDSQRRSFLQQCDQDEQWLYEDGDAASFEAYNERVNALRAIGDAAHARLRNRDDVDFAMRNFTTKINKAKETALNKIGQAEHITEDELRAAAATADEALAWAQEEQHKLMQQPKYEDAKFTPRDLEQRAATVTSSIQTLVSRPAPAKPAASPTSAQPAGKEENKKDECKKDAAAGGAEAQQQQQQEVPPAQQPQAGASETQPKPASAKDELD